MECVFHHQSQDEGLHDLIAAHWQKLGLPEVLAVEGTEGPMDGVEKGEEV